MDEIYLELYKKKSNLVFVIYFFSYFYLFKLEMFLAKGNYN